MSTNGSSSMSNNPDDSVNPQQRIQNTSTSRSNNPLSSIPLSTTDSIPSHRNSHLEDRSFMYDAQSYRRRSSINETPLRHYRNIDDPHEQLSISLRKRRLMSEVLESQHDTQYTQYGRTPMLVRRIRAARGDIGDMGREYLMQDFDVNRLFFFVDSDVEQTYDRFTNFLFDFNPENYPDIITELDKEIIKPISNFPHNLSYYRKKLIKIVESTNEKTFPIDLTHIYLFDSKLYNLIINYPADSICEIDKAVRKFIEKNSVHIYNISELTLPPRTVFYNKPETDYSMTLGPKNIETLVTLKGLIVRLSNVIPEMTVAAFRCNGYKQLGLNTVACNNEIYEHVIQGDVVEPVVCKSCGSRNSFELVHNMCVFTSKQLIKFVELHDLNKKNHLPSSISLYAYDECIDSAKPGDRVEITGIFRVSGVRINPRMRSLSSIFKTFINVIHIRRIEKLSPKNYQLSFNPQDLNDEKPIQFPPDLVYKILKLSQDKNIYEKLIKSFAPSIYGRDDVKMGLLCQLFGASKNEHRRNEIHILLCGDPSTAKSQFLQYVHKLSSRGIYTSGRGSSQVGLTAYVGKDPDTHEYILESGAVVLSDHGICCIDEFDKMNESARAILHEVMEQQTVTIAKAGIVATLNARTAILASANPINSRYNRRKAVVENINLPPSLISRFDLIYLIIDTANEIEDRALAMSICSNYSDKQDIPIIDINLFASYITYARANCNPVLSNNAKEIIVSEYLKLRSNDATTALFGGSVISSKAPCASTRQMEALVRLSQSIAKMRLSPTVEVKDVQEATRLMKVATFASLIDPSSGKIDFDQLHIGQTVVNMGRIKEIKDMIIKNTSINPISRDELFKTCQSKLPDWFDYKLFDTSLFDLESSLSITIKNGLIKHTSF